MPEVIFLNASALVLKSLILAALPKCHLAVSNAFCEDPTEIFKPPCKKRFSDINNLQTFSINCGLDALETDNSFFIKASSLLGLKISPPFLALIILLARFDLFSIS